MRVRAGIGVSGFGELADFVTVVYMSNIQIQNPNISDALVVVSAKEHGKLFRIRDGEMKVIEYVSEHPPQYSDNEGFFTQGTHGAHLGSGAVKEVDDQRNLDRYISAITKELSDELKQHEPKRVLVFEPEHLKGLIAEHLVNPDHIPVDVVRYGNFVEKSPHDLAEMLEAFENEEVDPADPESVAGEANAEEKRKILEVGEMRDGK